MGRKKEKIGLWMIGAAGGVGSTVALGVAALGKGLAPTTGLVSDLPPFKPLGLVDPGSIVIGGHEVRQASLLDAVRSLHKQSGLFDADLIASCTPFLRAAQRNIRPGTLCGAGSAMKKMADRLAVEKDRCPAAAVERMVADINAFRRRHRIDRVVVVHLASTEPPAAKSAAHARFDRLEKAIARHGSRALPTSSLYALAAIEARCAFINFTPSMGIRIPALQQRAQQLEMPYMGDDGKTGETLVKSVLAPMFAMRNLSVLSWVGSNILGNRDGAILSDPGARASKIRSKDKTLSQILGKGPTSQVSIDFVPSLDDWKVAWDFIHFEGFLGTKMNMQFTWQGSDSILAAPLIIDLARFAALQLRLGRGGPMKHLGFFFKDPIGGGPADLSTQWATLLEHLVGKKETPSGRSIKRTRT